MDYTCAKFILYQVQTLWDHSFLSCAVDKQTNKQTDSKFILTPTDIVGVGNQRQTFAEMSVYAHVPRRPSQALVLSVRDVLLCPRINELFRETKVYYMYYAVLSA